MNPTNFSDDEIRRRGKELYAQSIRARVEADENLGKVVVIDIETGDYLIDLDADNPVLAAITLQQRHPGAILWGERIGYDAVFAFGGADLRQTTRC